MRKVVLVIFPLLLLASCAKDGAIVDTSLSPIELKAGFEEEVTKALIDGDAINWESTDKVGLVVSNGNKNWYTNAECWTSDRGSSAVFRSTKSYSEWDIWNIAAFIPWQGEGSGVNNFYSKSNNAYEGVMYFKYPNSYGDFSTPYTDGRVYLPMLANMDNTDIHPSSMFFRHVGSAVKITIDNFPAYAHSFGLTVKGQRIIGDFGGLYYKNAGTPEGALSSETSSSGNSVWFNFSKRSDSEKLTFVFPIPQIPASKMAFNIYDILDNCLWSKNLVEQPALNRGDVLVFEPGEITYSKDPSSMMNVTPNSWFVRGSFIDNWEGAQAMCTNASAKYFVLKSVTLNDNSQFKVTNKSDDWNCDAYPKDNYVFDGRGNQYDIYFDKDSHEIRVVDPGTYPVF